MTEEVLVLREWLCFLELAGKFKFYFMVTQGEICTLKHTPKSLQCTLHGHVTILSHKPALL